MPDNHETTLLLMDVADLIRRDPVQYDQSSWFDLVADPNVGWTIDDPLSLLDQHEQAQQTNCGATCCISGHAVVLAGRERVQRISAHGLSEMTSAGAELLGLDPTDAEALFHSFHGHDHRMAANLLESLAGIPAQERWSTEEARDLIDAAIDQDCSLWECRG